MSKLRPVVFWLHLVAGVVAGATIAIMSFTGVALAFEKEIIAWAERDVRDRKSTRLNSSHRIASRMPSSA